jgi:hypothetical protein
MPITHSCFLSYPYNVGNDVERFVTRLETELRDRGMPYLGMAPYSATERLKGLKVEAGIARALCESVCMIAVYMPMYERHPFCLREFAAMEAHEFKRRKLLGEKLHPEQTMILTIVFRYGGVNGGRVVPKWIKEGSYFDFSDYAMTARRFFANSKCVSDLETMIKRIVAIHAALQTLPEDPCGIGQGSSLPSEDEVKSRLVAAPPWQKAPLRE